MVKYLFTLDIFHHSNTLLENYILFVITYNLVFIIFLNFHIKLIRQLQDLLVNVMFFLSKSSYEMLNKNFK